jgi:hypothetical protein
VQWALQLATYSTIILFLLLLALSRWVLGEKAFRVEELNAAQIENGKTPKNQPSSEGGGKWRRAIRAIVDFI